MDAEDSTITENAETSGTLEKDEKNTERKIIKRKVLTVAEKAEIIRRFEKGEKNIDISKAYGLPSSTVSTLRKNKATILKAFESNITDSKRLKKCEKPDLDEALAKWCLAQINAGLSLSGNIVKAQASKFAREFGYENFICSNGWIDRFKNRHRINYARVGKERSSKASKSLTDNMSQWIQSMWQDYKREQISNDVYTQICREQPSLQCSDVSESTTEWLETMWLDNRSEYSEDDIYNAEEIGLIFDLTPDQTEKFQGEICAKGELPERRLTVLICTNMSGTDKRKLLIVGHSAKSSCLKYVKQLPVDYVSNIKAWITPQIFATYMHQWDTEVRKKDRRIILLIDNGTAHTNISNLTNIKLVFLPPNSDPALLPMHQGIIRSFKAYYRKELLILLNGKMQKNQDLKVPLIDGIRIINDAWYDIAPDFVRHCFVNAMLQHKPEVDERHAGSLSEWMRLENVQVFNDVRNIEDFISADDGVATSGIPTVKEIVEEMKLKNRNAGSENSEEKRDAPTLNEALECADRLQQYFETTSTDNDLFDALNIIRHELREQRRALTAKTAKDEV